MMLFSEIALNRAVGATNRLTKPATYSSLWGIQYLHDLRASRAGCATTPHGSNPTLFTPVIGLLGIIQDDQLLVLHGKSSPADSHVGLGCFAFRALGAR